MEHLSTKWRQFGTQITLTQNTMDGWFSDTRDTESCWERVMQAWLQGRGKKEYPPTWEGLYKLLRDVRKEAVVPVLREAVDRAVLPGTSMLSSKVCNYQLNCVCFSTRSFPVMSVLLLLLFKRGIYNCSSNCLSFMHSILSPLHMHSMFQIKMLLFSHSWRSERSECSHSQVIKIEICDI